MGGAVILVGMLSVVAVIVIVIRIGILFGSFQAAAPASFVSADLSRTIGTLTPSLLPPPPLVVWYVVMVSAFAAQSAAESMLVP